MKVTFVEAVSFTAILLIVLCLLNAHFGFGGKYTVKVRGEVIHEHATIYKDYRTNTLTVYDQNGKTYMYSNDWEAAME